MRERQQRDVEEAIQKVRDRSGLPLAYRQSKQPRTRWHLNPSQLARLRAIEGVGAADLHGAYIHGAAGVGKTSIACVLLAEQIAASRTGKYVTTTDLFADLHEIYAAMDGRSGLTVIDPLVECAVLVLDDIGKEKPSEHAANIFFSLLDQRYRRRAKGRWTIVLSNFAPDKLIARFGTFENADPIARRLTEDALIIEMK